MFAHPVLAASSVASTALVDAVLHNATLPQKKILVMRYERLANEAKTLTKINEDPAAFAKLSPTVRATIRRLDEMVTADTSRLTRALFSNWRALTAKDFRRRVTDLHLEAATRGMGAVKRLMGLYPKIGQFLTLHTQVMAAVTSNGRNAVGALFESADRLDHEISEAEKRVATAINAQQVWDKRFSKAADKYTFGRFYAYETPTLDLANDSLVQEAFVRGMDSFQSIAGTPASQSFRTWLTRVVEVIEGRKSSASLNSEDLPRKPRARAPKSAGEGAPAAVPRQRAKKSAAAAQVPARPTAFGMGEETLGVTPGALQNYNADLELFNKYTEATRKLTELERSAAATDDELAKFMSSQLLALQRAVVEGLAAQIKKVQQRQKP
jgi:hypothetical protein